MIPLSHMSPLSRLKVVALRMLREGLILAFLFGLIFWGTLIFIGLFR